jgi:large subunit ribosomal protein L32
MKEVGIMAVPARKTSKTKKNKRRTHLKLEVPGMVKCPDCGELKLAHRVCKSCGTYNGKQVVNK